MSNRAREVNHVAKFIAEDLYFDMAGVGDEAFEIQGWVAEGRARLGGGRCKNPRQFAWIVNNLHAAPAAASGGLHHHRIANPFRYLDRVGGRTDLLRARKRRHPRFVRELTRGDLVSHLAHVIARRTDEDQPYAGAGIGEFRLLRKKAVARMHGIASRRHGGR